jgi:CRP/FNR family transcriptional regulator, anaerobic regulatory protein
MLKRRSCAVCAVRHRALCGSLEREALPRLSRVVYQRRYNAGQFIAGAGQRQEWFATVLSGVVKLTKVMADGRQQIVGLLFAGDFLGRPFAANSPYRAEAATTVELCCVERRYFEDLILSCPGVKQSLLERAFDEIDAARDWMLVLGCKTAEEKVASLILLIIRRLGSARADEVMSSEPIGYELPLSRTEMAEYLGLRIETVSRQIKRLRAAGIIEIDTGRGIKVPAIAELERIAGKDPV